MKKTKLLSLVLAFVMVLTVFSPVMPVSAAEEEPLKTRPTFFTPEKVQNARDNIANYSWAKKEAASYAATAEKFISQGYEFIWYSLPSQGLPRSYGVNQTLGCLNCGKDIDAYGNYPYKYDPVYDPWKITCPSCLYKFPTNDFESFYKSALDENGNFDASRGDKQYLKNVLYPEKGKTWGVDDGWGYIDANGNKYTMVAYYNHEVFRYSFHELITALYYSYVYTGEQKYADYAIVMLDRLASIYPDMNIKNQTVADGFLHSNGGSQGEGKIMGRIWECSIVQPYLYAYDAVFDAYDTMSDEAKDFLKTVSNGERDTYKKLQCHVENGFVKQIFPAFVNCDILGNTGMHQYALALAAVVLDDEVLTKQWLDYDFQSGKRVNEKQSDGTVKSTQTGGNLLAALVDTVDRDGYGNEVAPQYNALWVNNYINIAELLKGYRIGGDGESYDLYDNVKFKKMMYAFLDLIIADQFTPPIGDSGKTGYSGIVADKDILTKAYAAYKDPYLAQALYLVNGNSARGLNSGIFGTDADVFKEEIESIVEEYGELTIDSVNLAGYGYASVKDFAEETGDETTLYMYYGKNTGHGHKDTLNIGLYAYDMDLMPDLGYPEYADSTDMHRKQLVSNTISHNTVVVNNKTQSNVITGIPLLYDADDFVKVISAEANDAYDKADTYKRTTAMITAGDGEYYVVDFFKVTGSKEHTYILHGAESSEVTTEGLTIVKQVDENGNYVGTLKGPSVEYGDTIYSDGQQWFQNVRTAEDPSSGFSVDWSIVDTWKTSNTKDVHLKVTMLGDYDSVTLSDATPPTNKPGNPESLTYLMVNRTGNKLDSLFQSVIEPYAGESKIESIESVPVMAQGSSEKVDSATAQAIKVVLKSGRTDYIAYCAEDTGVTYSVDGVFDFTGTLAVYSVEGDDITTYTCDAYIGDGDISDQRLTGTVKDFTRELTDENYIYVTFDSEVDPATLTGQYIYMDGIEKQNACFEILSAEKTDDGYALYVGDVTLIASYLSSYNQDAGYKYVTKKKASFYIPISTVTKTSLTPITEPDTPPVVQTTTTLATTPDGNEPFPIVWGFVGAAFVAVSATVVYVTGRNRKK